MKKLLAALIAFAFVAPTFADEAKKDEPAAKTEKKAKKGKKAKKAAAEKKAEEKK